MLRFKTFLFPIVLILTFDLTYASFHIGRVPPSQFELPELNGYFRAEDAAMACDHHSQCGGFTYKGILNDTRFNTGKPIMHETYFFRYVKHFNRGQKFSNWVTYKSEKPYARYDGQFQSSLFISLKTEKYFDNERPFSDILCGRNTECAAFVVDKETNKIIGKMHKINLDMNDFAENNNTFTLINVNAKVDKVQHEIPDLDLCCPSHKLDDRLDLSTITDDVERISCDTSPEDIMENVILQRKGVIIQGCLDEWNERMKDWSIENFLKDYPGHTWNTDVVFHDEITKGMSPEEILKNLGQTIVEDDEDALPTSEELIHVFKHSNVSMKIFERLGIPAGKFAVRSSSSSEKFHVRDNWKWPKCLPRDLYMPSLGGTDYQWVILATVNTGTHCHNDPLLTDAWNALIKGHKVWVLFPNEIRVEKFYNCDRKCNKYPDEDQMFILPWFKHVLPQLMKMQWYGKKVQVVIQKPGDIIYVPSTMGHIVLNIDETVSVTENFLSIASIKDELALFKTIDYEIIEVDTNEPTNLVWRNLMNRDLNEFKDIRRYAREMLRQVESVGKSK